MFLLWLITCIFSHSTIFGSENILRTELTDIEEKVQFYCLYAHPWETVKQYYQKHNVSFNVPLISNVRPLMTFLLYERLYLVQNLLEEENIDVDFIDETLGQTPLHKAIEIYKKKLAERDDLNPIHNILSQIAEGYDVAPCISIIKQLIQKGCSVNAFDRCKDTALSALCKGPFEVVAEKIIDDNINNEENIFDFLMSNGAMLMVKEGRKRWNILEEFVGYLRRTYHNECIYLPLNTTIDSVKRIAKGALYNKCKYDYKTYCTAFFNTALVFKKLRSEKNINFPKVLTEHITSFIAPHPVQHIEDTLCDAWSNQAEYIPPFLETHESEDIKNNYNELINHTTPGAWKDAWSDFKNKDRSETNLIVRALNYKVN